MAAHGLAPIGDLIELIDDFVKKKI